MKHDKIITIGPGTLSEFLAHRGTRIAVSIPVLREMIRQEKEPAPRPRRVYFGELFDEVPLSVFPKDQVRRFGLDYIWYVACFINYQLNGRTGDLSLIKKNIVFAEEFGIELSFGAADTSWSVQDRPFDFVYQDKAVLIQPGQ